ncbi:MAG: undecaprenyldiphospho-muramoylpentapeptide beta-N-acetylglucosaminyltransferase [Flavobacteriales bacterium]
MTLNRIIISGGGTGGHIYPAIAIAEALKTQHPGIDILFVGAHGKMEMEKVPQAGFPIKGLKIAGFNRKNLLKNAALPFKILNSISSAYSIVKSFKPQLVIGVGGYASGPTLQVANWLKIPTLIQEQNSFPGKTNMILAKKAKAICVAYPDMDRFFPKEVIHLTGNPVRKDLIHGVPNKQEGFDFYGLDAAKQTVFIMGGSLGAGSINLAVVNAVEKLKRLEDIQVIWQCGKGYFETYNKLDLPSHIKLLPFIERMDLAYAVADVIISRAGATSISELTLVGKPCILVPSPNVTEDHQTKNAMSLTTRNAAILVPDNKVEGLLWSTVQEILTDSSQAKTLSEAIKQLALPNATEDIVRICNQLTTHDK